MSKKLYDFECQACKNCVELFVEDYIDQVVCEHCNQHEPETSSWNSRFPPTKESMTLQLAIRKPSAPRCFQNTVGKSPSATNR